MSPRTDDATVDELIERALEANAGGRIVELEECCRAVIRMDPLDVRARQLLGVALTVRGETAEAVELLESAAAMIGPLTADTFAVHNNLANARRAHGQVREALSAYEEMVKLVAGEWQVWHNYGMTLKDAGRLDEAVAHLRRAVAMAPEYGPNHGVLGHILHELGRLRSADAALRRCIAVGYDNDVNVWTLLGNNHRWMAEMEQAQFALERALEISNGAPEACNNKAILLSQQGHFDEAKQYYDLACDAQPDNDLWASNRGFSRLAAGDLDAGWVGWERGLRPGGPRGDHRKLNVDVWTPADAGARVICYREQGVGDEILLASCLPDLAAATREVIYECDTRLVDLLARSFPQIEVRAQTVNRLLGETKDDFDRMISIGSLPMHFRPTVDSFPGRRSFVVADAERVERWKSTFEALGTGPRVAISWRSKIKTAERRLEYTRLLDDWGPIFSSPGVAWVNVQYDDCERELRDAERKFGITIHRSEDVDYLNDFDEVAAIVSACDLVVSPRNAVAMLSGGLGVPTVMMGNRWDWSDLGTDTSPWFPSVQLVYRHLGDDWDGVIAQAAASVRELTP
ncbi:MAG: tetratricopeptide repeat protein [Actinomycetota bacterium]|nr:tetratricopeptide repeat protein [Actinomycetota bacterium]